ncbi:MAG: tetratricopeptide repeat protein [Acidisphaera sp.]|nr:tetratricopeptide repeat protein [Acidisphaera sp.]
MYASGRFNEAAQALHAFLETHPDDAGAACDLGNALLAQGRIAEGAEYFRRALQIDPGFATAHTNLGVALLKLKRLHEGVASLEQALALAPDDPIACYNYGIALRYGGRHEEAVTALRHAQTLRPEHAETANELGNALRLLQRSDEAVEAYRRALALRPGFTGAAHNLGTLLQSERRFDEAAAAFRTALDAAPDRPDYWNDLGSALQGAGRFAEALASYQQALVVQPGMAAAHSNLALSLASLDRIEEGILACRRAIAIEAGAPVPNMNMGCLLLTLGRFREGWEAYEYRFAATRNAWLRADARAEPWLGENLADKSILVLGEQGNGDHIHFVRYLPLLVDLGATVSLLCPARLHRLFSTLRGPVTLLDSMPAGARFDFQVPLLSLPHRFDSLGFGMPAEVPYLAAEPERVARWREHVGSAGLRVGIAWQGNPAGNVDAGRSYPLARLRPLAAIPGVRLISLQRGEGTEQLEKLPPDMRVETLGPEFDAGEDGFLDAAAVMRAVDLVVTSDTAIAHLAGALGCQVWLALSHMPEWRWLRERRDNPWYPTARLFRQQAHGDWDSVFTQMTAELAPLARQGRRTAPDSQAVRAAPHVPVSWGELLDKVSILEIKAERLTEPAALANVARELDSLRVVVRGSGDLPQLEALRQALREINERLWCVEDEIRACESDGRFDARFIELARMVYRLNDERGRIKRRINEESGSSLVEEKQYQSY